MACLQSFLNGEQALPLSIVLLALITKQSDGLELRSAHCVFRIYVNDQCTSEEVVTTTHPAHQGRYLQACISCD